MTATPSTYVVMTDAPEESVNVVSKPLTVEVMFAR
jgi:hypothetical protein